MSDSPFSEEKLSDDLIYKTLLESTLAIPWRMDWATKQYTYVGPQIEKLLGWQQDSWKTVHDWAMRIHQEDRDKIYNTCFSQTCAGIDHEMDYRALTASGEYIWVREVVHVIQNDQGETTALVGFIFDISARKKQEQELESLKRQLEEYSYQDSLTGIANRRLFEELFQREWLSAIREQHDFSMIMLDIDYFKAYNDAYGHLQGDQCLLQIAQIIQQALTRPRDVVARFGGEEFVIILPDTTQKAALIIAERIQDNLKKANIPHKASTIAQYVTVSMGLKTAKIQEFEDRVSFLSEIDQALYQAKHAGRNCFHVVSDVTEKPSISVKKSYG